MAFGLFSGSTPTYKGAGTIQPRQNAGVTGFLTNLFGGAQTPAYTQPPPAAPAALAANDNDTDEPNEPVVANDKALTVIVVLDTEALAEALLPHLKTAAASISDAE